MKLDFDCVRKFLLYAEEQLKVSKQLPLTDFIQQLSDFPEEDVIYSAKILKEEGFISVLDLSSDVNNAGLVPNAYFVQDITLSGHKYLDSVRDTKFWNTVKKELPTLAQVTLPAALEHILSRLFP